MMTLNVLVFAVLFLSVVDAASNEKQNNYLKRSGAQYLKKIAAQPGIISLKSGMLIEVLKASTKVNAKSPTENDDCDVTYKGTLKNGEQFDAGTTSFAPNQVIKGWTQAMQMMVEGDKWKLYIPYDLAYGEYGSPPKIPPFSPLVFEIEIHKVKGKGKSAAEAKKLLADGTAETKTDL